MKYILKNWVDFETGKADSYESAKEWLSKHLCGDVWLDLGLFGSVEITGIITDNIRNDMRINYLDREFSKLHDKLVDICPHDKLKDYCPEHYICSVCGKVLHKKQAKGKKLITNEYKEEKIC